MTANQLSTLDFSNNLILNQLDMPDKSALVYDYSNGYNVVDFLVTKNATPRMIDGEDGKFYKPIMGISQVIAEVASTVAVTTTRLRVNFVDPTYDLFRLTETVSDGTANNYMGRVIEHNPGYIVLECAPPITAWDTTIHFVAGTFATVLFQSSANRASVGMESLYEYPEYVHNHTSIIRESVELFRRDMAKTWVKFNGDYWYSAQDEMAVKRFARESEFRALWSKYGQITSSALGGTVNYSMGLKDAIQNNERGGIYTPLSSAMSQGDFETFIGRVADKQSAAQTNLTLVMGRGALKQIQSFTSPYIQFGGKENTFGGDTVKGIDVYKYSIGGINCDFVMAPALNDKDRFPQVTTVPGLAGNTRLQYTLIALDMSNYQSVGNGGELPAMEKCYFGSKEISYEYLKGVAMGGAKPNVQGATSGVLGPVNDRDGISFQIYSDCAYDFMANRMGWLELIV